MAMPLRPRVAVAPAPAATVMVFWIVSVVVRTDVRVVGGDRIVVASSWVTVLVLLTCMVAVVGTEISTVVGTGMGISTVARRVVGMGTWTVVVSAGMVTSIVTGEVVVTKIDVVAREVVRTVVALVMYMVECSVLLAVVVTVTGLTRVVVIKSGGISIS